MRSLMIVVPDEILDGSASCCKRKERADIEAFIVDRTEEALDFAIRLWRVRFEDVVANIERRARLLKPGQTIREMGVAHRKRHGAVRQHRFNAIRQGLHDMLQERRGGVAGLLGANGHDRLATEIIDRRKFEVISSISQGREKLQIEVQQLARAGFLVAPRLRSGGTRQLIEPLAL